MTTNSTNFDRIGLINTIRKTAMQCFCFAKDLFATAMSNEFDWKKGHIKTSNNYSRILGRKRVWFSNFHSDSRIGKKRRKTRKNNNLLDLHLYSLVVSTTCLSSLSAHTHTHTYISSHSRSNQIHRWVQSQGHENRNAAQVFKPRPPLIDNHIECCWRGKYCVEKHQVARWLTALFSVSLSLCVSFFSPALRSRVKEIITKRARLRGWLYACCSCCWPFGDFFLLAAALEENRARVLLLSLFFLRNNSIDGGYIYNTLCKKMGEK